MQEDELGDIFHYTEIGLEACQKIRVATNGNHFKNITPGIITNILKYF